MMKTIIITIISINLSINLMSQINYIPSKENLEAREWFQEAQFGLFVHWGVYSLLGDGEWVMNNQNFDVRTYEKLAGFFNPTQFDADEWVKMAKDAGMKYITFTTRHHDGFSMFDTDASDYNIVDATPCKKDILKSLAEACHKYDVKLFLYYSLLDWNRPDYFPRGRTGKGINGHGEGKWDDYIEFMKAQLTELLTNYGEIAGIWFDGYWDQMDWDGKELSNLKVDWKTDEIYALIHSLQPQALIGNNHHLAPLRGEDFQMFEHDLPGQNTSGFGTAAKDLGELPFEMCETINHSWGFNLQDSKNKSKKELIQTLVKAAGHNSNLLLNVGPMPNGKIQPEHKKLLSEVGDWLRQNGITIYAAGSGPVEPSNWGVSTQKGNIVYLHILDWDKQALLINDYKPEIKSMKYYSSGENVKYEITSYGMVILLNEKERSCIDTIIELTLK